LVPISRALLQDVIITRGEEEFPAKCRMQTRVAWCNPDTELQVGDVVTYGERKWEITKVTPVLGHSSVDHYKVNLKNYKA
jgi:hypothetical protein